MDPGLPLRCLGTFLIGWGLAETSPRKAGAIILAGAILTVASFFL